MMFFCSCGKKLASRKGLSMHILETTKQTDGSGAKNASS